MVDHSHGKTFIEKSRREFLKKAGAGVATIALGSGITLFAYPRASARAPDEAASANVRFISASPSEVATLFGLCLPLSLAPAAVWSSRRRFPVT